MNKVELMGRLTADPELQYGGQGGETEYVRITLAVDRRFKRTNDNEPTADFIYCTAFGKTAEFISNYFQKGSRLAVSGRIQTDRYTNKDGQNVTSFSVIIEDAEFCESKNSNGNSNGNTASANRNNGTNRNNRNNNAGAKGRTNNRNDDFMNIPDDLDDDALPFN